MKQHLHSISFINNIPNTALMSLVDAVGGSKMFNITFRAGLLDENISQWATWKENTCFIQEADSNYKVCVEGGNLDAIVYVLMHEATHIVDVVTGVTPHPAETNAAVEPTASTKDVWRLMNVPDRLYIDSLLERTRFRSGKPSPINLAPDVYRKLSKTPFPSLPWRRGQRILPGLPSFIISPLNQISRFISWLPKIMSRSSGLSR